MLRELLGTVWRGAPKFVRRWGVWLAEPRFTVTAGGVVLDERGRLLLLNHVFRKGSGWGIPGGFINHGEDPEEALRRELREEAGMELDDVRIAFARTHQRPRQVEIIFRCRARAASAQAQSLEINSAAWFALDALPPELSHDQRGLIKRALNDDAPEAE
ncbi:MAG TPA: NUDIX domain-containing protein [Pyrinomonadaceae bacterium]|jgi:ADP-ribose pyrophosphatase YjhB (NUDIX family)